MDAATRTIQRKVGKMTNIQAIDLLKDLEQRLDDYCELNDEGKTAFRMAITALEVFGNSEQLPSAQASGKDPIEREAVVDILHDAMQGCSESEENLIGEIVCKVDLLPSAQPEIIRCCDCKHSEHWYRDKARCFLWHEEGIDVFEDGYCSYAERREDG